MRNIEEGDKVFVSMSRNDLFYFQSNNKFPAIVKHVPQNTGDLWYMETIAGQEFTINPQSSDFVGMSMYIKGKK